MGSLRPQYRAGRLVAVVVGLIFSVVWLVSWQRQDAGVDGGPPSRLTDVILPPKDQHVDEDVRFFANLGKYYETAKMIQREMETSYGKCHPLGNIAWHPTQLYYYARKARSTAVKTICEVGFGLGHSSLMYLMVNPNAKVYVFDIFEVREASFIKDYIENHADYGKRFLAIKGDSNRTIPDFAAQHPDVKCDMFHVDGSHDPPQPYYDVVHFHAMSSRSGTPLLLDDMQSLKSELDRAAADGRVRIKECLVAESITDPTFACIPQIDKTFCSSEYL